MGGTALEKKQEDGRCCRAYLRTMDPEQAAAEIGTEVVQYVPRSGDIQIAENQGGTVSEFVKDSSMVQVYNELAERVLAMSEDEEE